jgi:uncharacterized protein DUF6527
VKLRTDSFHIAGWKRAHALRGCDCPPGQKNHVAHKPRKYREPAAELGDVWKLHNRNGGLVGYALTCPLERCDQGVHAWDHAYNCAQRTDPDAPPCWTWTGSVEDGTLTASPSLMVMTEIDGRPLETCGWHGWLRDGVMSSA